VLAGRPRCRPYYADSIIAQSLGLSRDLTHGNQSNPILRTPASKPHTQGDASGLPLGVGSWGYVLGGCVLGLRPVGGALERALVPSPHTDRPAVRKTKATRYYGAATAALIDGSACLDPDTAARRFWPPRPGKTRANPARHPACPAHLCFLAGFGSSSACCVVRPLRR
jgi:hypothetical protein